METNGLFSTKFFYFNLLGYFYIHLLTKQRRYIIMTYETFLKITLQLQKNDRDLQELYKRNVDLLEFIEPWEKVISLLLTEVYGEEGYDWFSWFCYENDFGQKGVGAWDSDGNPICVDIQSTWEYLETNYNKQKQ